ncbi:hypothetical protein [Polyangium fumosum]|uniref:Uncharacterized protein n=1 Tax=Polyangium fumosum TaxID=889272 RepID=A0A4U1J3T3_9BACT|nr:hypothetical protein [Polyangium fumosum]TKD01847.1 hypothetical protein E8A74_30155 [Polyangium fumosum]
MPKRRPSAAGRDRRTGPDRPQPTWIRHLLGVGLAAAVGCFVAPASAAPGDAQAQKGIALARKGECGDAVPLLEEAEGLRHRPETAVALASCYEMAAELLQASALYGVVAEEPPDRTHTRGDRAAIQIAKRKLREIEDRIPTLTFVIPKGYEGVVVTIDGEPLEQPAEPQKVDPGDELAVVMKAKGRKERKETITLEERERRIVTLDLAPLGAAAAPGPMVPSKEPRLWLGAAYRGYVIPRFAMNIFGDGGRTVIAPGGALSLVRPAGNLDITFTLGYAAFFLPPTPFKPRGTPDTEYEIVSADLSSLQASFELVWNVPLDRRQRFRFRIGGGLGVGYTFLGGLYRTQAYPPGFSPADPYTYRPCTAPNDPPGSFRYCNQLDKDVDHYGGYEEPSWFSGGVRPLVYPWIVLPLVGLSFRPTPGVSIDLDVAPTLSGILTGLGVRFGL